MNETQKHPFYQSKWFIFLCFFFFPPVGIILLWIFHPETKSRTKAILTVIGVIWFFILATSANSNKNNNSNETGSMQTTSSVENSNTEANTEKNDVNTKPESPLLSYKLKKGDVKNGTKTEIIGEYAYIEIPEDVLNAITPDDILAFANERVDNSGYNYVTIAAENGKGICFEGSQIYSASYGLLDDDRTIETRLGTWTRADNGTTYTFKEKKNAAKKEAAAIKRKEKKRKKKC